MAVYRDLDIGLLITPSGNIHIKKDQDVIIQSIKTILSTVKGERIMNPTFGSNIKYVLFDPMDDITENVIKTEIQDSINEWEDRVYVDDVLVESLYDLNIYSVTIYYTIAATGVHSEFSLGLQAK